MACSFHFLHLGVSTSLLNIALSFGNLLSVSVTVALMHNTSIPAEPEHNVNGDMILDLMQYNRRRIQIQYSSQTQKLPSCKNFLFRGVHNP
jgi:hypothetical protein